MAEDTSKNEHVHNEEMDESLSTQEVCDELDISKRTLQNWEKAGVIPKVRRDWRGYRVFTKGDINDIREVIRKKARRNRSDE